MLYVCCLSPSLVIFAEDLHPSPHPLQKKFTSNTSPLKKKYIYYLLWIWLLDVQQQYYENCSPEIIWISDFINQIKLLIVSSFWQLARHWKGGYQAKLEVEAFAFSCLLPKKLYYQTNISFGCSTFKALLQKNLLGAPWHCQEQALQV